MPQKEYHWVHATKTQIILYFSLPSFTNPQGILFVNPWTLVTTPKWTVIHSLAMVSFCKNYTSISTTNQRMNNMILKCIYLGMIQQAINTQFILWPFHFLDTYHQFMRSPPASTCYTTLGIQLYIRLFTHTFQYPHTHPHTIKTHNSSSHTFTSVPPSVFQSPPHYRFFTPIYILYTRSHTPINPLSIPPHNSFISLSPSLRYVQ